MTPQTFIYLLPILFLLLGLYVGHVKGYAKGFLKGFAEGFALGKAELPSGPVRVSFIIDGKEITKMFAKVDQVVDVAAVFKDSKGNVVQEIDEISWALTDAALGSLVIADDKKSAQFTPAGQVGSLAIQLAAKDNGKDILGSLDVQLLEADAASVELSGVAKDVV